MCETTDSEAEKLSKVRYTNIGYNDGDPVGVCIFIQASELRHFGVDLSRDKSIAYQLVSVTDEATIRVMNAPSLDESNL